MSADLDVRARARRRGRRDHARALPGARPARRDEARPDARVARPTARPRRRSARSSRASGRGEGVLGEELGDDGGDVRWIVDPIDGTRNYVRGVPVWATLLALEREGVVDARARLRAGTRPPLVGGARRGRLGGQRRARVACLQSPGSRTRPSRRPRRAACRPAGASSPSARWTPRGFGDFWQHCLVAEGASTLAADPVLTLWDYAGVQLLVEEAGGRCTTFDGSATGARRDLPRHERPPCTTRRSRCSAPDMPERAQSSSREGLRLGEPRRGRLLVDRVAAEAVELGASRSLGVRRLARAGTAPARRRGRCSRAARARRARARRSWPSRERSQPREERPCAARPADANRAHVGDRRPERREQRSATARSAPTRCRTRRRGRRLREPAVGGRQLGPLRRVDDQRSAIVDELLQLASRRTAAGRASGRTPAGRRSRAAARSTPAPCARLPRSVSSITSPQTARSPTGKHRIETSASSPSGSLGLRHEQHRSRRMPLRHALERLARRRRATPAAPRRCASSRSCAGSAARPPATTRDRSSRELALDLRDRRRPRRPSESSISVFATSGRPGEAARRPRPAPTCPPRSSGTTAGRAARTRRSRRRAPTAPRSRPSG